MALFEGKTPAERNKMIAAAVLPLLALVFVVRMLFGSPAPTRPASNGNNKAGANSNRNAARANPNAPDLPPSVAEVPTRVVYTPASIGGANAGRNIFAYYVRPEGTTSVKETPTPPPPTPMPPPPLLLSSLSPASVYARTSGFTMQVSGDKFTPESRVYIDGQEMPTKFNSPQQLSTTVNAAALSAQGARAVVVRTPDNILFSNGATLNVMQPPAPTHTYVGMIGRQRVATGLLKNQKGELVSVQPGDIVEGRFRVAEISERAVDLVDKDLNIRHTLPYVESRTTGQTGRIPGSIQPPPPPKPDDGDEEP
jgi:hypothetical protein